MNCFKKLILCLLAVAFAAAGGFAENKQSATSLKTNSELIDSLRTELANIHTPADSIPLLYDIFDLAAYLDMYEAGETLYQTAVRAKDTQVQLDMICRLADISMRFAWLDKTEMMLDRLETFPDSQEKSIAKCFVVACLAPARHFTTEQELSDEIQRLLNEINEDSDKNESDRYERIARMLTLAEYLQGLTQGTYLTELIDRLNTEISQLPVDKASLIRNKFYASAAMMYMRNQQYEKAVKADRKLLAAQDRIEAQNAKQGRKYRDLIINRYISYRRMMKCYPALTLEETQELYDKIMELAARNSDIVGDMAYNPLPQMVLHMKRGEYAEALPLLKILTEHAGTLYEKRYFLRQLREAAEATGNKEELAKASIEYCKILEEYTDLKSAERMRELEVNYNYESLRETNAEQLRKRERTITTLSIIAFTLLIIVIIAFIIMATRLSSGKKKLAKANASLRTEGEELRQATESLTAARDRARKADTEKTQLVNYVTNELLNPINSIVEYSQMIIDNAQGENKKYLERFKTIVDMNIRLLKGLVGDVQELSVVENNELPINRIPVDLNAIGRTAIDSIRPQLNSNVKATFHPVLNGGQKTLFNTDPRRVEIVLLNLLNNAAKFTPSGSIDLKLQISPESGDAIFTVTDTGIGIPADKTEVIFNRFEKLNPEIEGSGLGLSVCALVCETLGASVRVDTTYPGPGSRFVFTIHPHD